MNNNYYDLAEEDLLEAEDRFKAQKYNKCAYWCQQSGEKYLKYVLVGAYGAGVNWGYNVAGARTQGFLKWATE